MASNIALCQAVFWKKPRSGLHILIQECRSQKSRNEHARGPSPEMQNLLYASHLGGMERPRQSFKSLMRIAPPRTSANKPLPPPESIKSKISTDSASSSLDYLPSRTAGYSLWEAPSTWDREDGCEVLSRSPFTIREYSLLIPEPPEDIAAMNADAALWQQGNGPFQQTPLDPICERNVITPDIPVRNPSRPSFRKNSKDTQPSISSRYSMGTFDERRQEEGHEETCGLPLDTGSTSPLDLISALSEISIQDKTLESSATEPVRDQLIAWSGQQQRSDSVQLDNESYVDLQGNKLTTFKRGSIVTDSIPFTSENMEDSDRLQALSFAQDYHNILADPDFDERTESRQDMPPLPPPKDQDPTPRPLTWRKDSGRLPSAGPSQCLQRPRMPPSSSSWRHRNILKMSSWVNHRLGKEAHGGAKQRAASDSELLSHSQPSENEDDRHFRHEARLTNIVQHGKDLVSRTILRRESEPKKALVITHPLPHHNPQDPTNASVSATPFELATPILRLPGGLTVVRQSSRPDTQPQTAESPSSPFSDLSWPNFPASSPFGRDFSRRGSWQSTQSQPRSGSSSLFAQKPSSPLAGSPLTTRSFSCSTTELGTSARDSTIHYTPPTTTRRRSHNIGSPLSAPPSQQNTGAEQCLEEAPEGSHKFNFIERAKGAHEAWRKHQREVKNEKLKQSIKLVGPADARDIAGFIKCAVDGRLSGDSGVGEGRFAGGEGKGV